MTPLPTSAIRHRARRAVYAFGPMALALGLGLTAQGSRSLWEPDEGRNTQIAFGMVETGDWLRPRLAGLVYLDKPPLAYWTIATARLVVGPTELAARLPNAIAFAIAAATLTWLGASMWGREIGARAGLAYALSLGPFVAASVVTPDTLLALWSTLAAATLWQAARSGQHRWWLLCGLVTGLGLMTKGSAMLVFVFAFGVAICFEQRGLRWLLRPGPWLALAAALLIGLPWYLWAIVKLPGAGDYFLVSQVTGRLVDDRYQRNSEWSKILTLYLPTLIGGSLPWGPVGLAAWLHRGHRLSGLWLRPSPAARFLGLWIALPCAVFFAASSRLPLYLLPLFAPLALLFAHATPSAHSTSAQALQVRRAAMTAWIGLLVTLKIVAVAVPSRQDGERIAEWIQGLHHPSSDQLWIVDTDLYSLPFYGLRDVQWATTRDDPYPMYQTPPLLSEALAETQPASLLAVTLQYRRRALADQVVPLGYRCRPEGARGRLVALRCARGTRSDDEITTMSPVALSGAASTD